MPRLVFSPTARADIKGIWNYIATQNAPAADRQVARINQRLKLISRIPEIGESRAELGPAIRQVIVDSYVVFYRLEPQAVRVLRVVHGARQMPDAFHEPPIG